MNLHVDLELDDVNDFELLIESNSSGIPYLCNEAVTEYWNLRGVNCDALSITLTDKPVNKQSIPVEFRGENAYFPDCECHTQYLLRSVRYFLSRNGVEGTGDKRYYVTLWEYTS